MLSFLFFLQLGFAVGNVVGMYLAQNYDVSIFAAFEIILRIGICEDRRVYQTPDESELQFPFFSRMQWSKVSKMMGVVDLQYLKGY